MISVSNHSKTKTLVLDSLIFALGSLGSKFILFILLPLYTNYLTAAEYGVADLVFTCSQLVEPFLSVVIFDAVIRFGLKRGEKPEEVLRCAVLVLVAGGVCLAALTPFLDFYDRLAPWKWHLCLYAILHCFYLTEMNYLKIRDKMKAYALISIGNTAAMALINLVTLTWLHMGIQGYLLANILSVGGACAAALCCGNMVPDLRRARLNRRLLKEMLLFSAPLILNNVSTAVIHSTDKIMLEVMLGATALGLYTVASKLPALINVMNSIFTQAWGLSAVREMESDNDKRFYRDVFRVYTCGISLWCMVLVAFIKPFMSVYVGAEYVQAWRYIPLLLAGAAFAAYGSFFGRMLSAMSKTVISMSATLAGAALNVALNLVGIHFLGIWGAVLATVACYVLMYLIKMRSVCRALELRLDGTGFVPSSLLLFIQAGAVSAGFYPGIISFVTLALFVVVNRRSLAGLCRQALGLGRSMLKKLKH